MSQSGLYIHVPFCQSRCDYCDFYSTVALVSDQGSVRWPSENRGFPLTDRHGQAASIFAASLQKEWRLRCHELGDDSTVRTIYFGGGTPSSLPCNIVEGFKTWLPETDIDGEFTFEANPDDITTNPDIATAWRALGANRVSMGIQSLNDEELAAVGRRHTARQAMEAYRILRQNFDNISLDLIIGLPGQTPHTFLNTLRSILQLRPEHLSVYILSYEPGTALSRRLENHEIEPMQSEIVAELYMLTHRLATAAGYNHYEVSNFCLPGRESRHNSSYWSSIPYLGLGPSAHSFDGTNRSYNPSSLKQWVEKLTKGQNPAEPDPEEPKQRTNDVIMTRLRTARGLHIDTDIPPDHRDEFIRNLMRLPADRAIIEGNWVRISPEGWLLSDDTLLRLILC